MPQTANPAVLVGNPSQNDSTLWGDDVILSLRSNNKEPKEEGRRFFRRRTRNAHSTWMKMKKTR